MKKIFLFLILGSLLITGCSIRKKDASEEFSKKIEKASSYYVEGSMDIINNEDTYTYDVKVSYQKDNNYKVELTNISNNHKQVILRNSDGVYVVTPSLNKSFKFQSDWPLNNSQIYLLGSLVEDLNNDENKTVEETKDGYTLTSIVNYPNNKKLVKQKIMLDKNYDVKEVTVLDDSDNIQIKMVFNKIDLKSEFDDNYFKLNELIKEDTKEENNNTNTNENTNTNTNTNENKDTNTNDNTGTTEDKDTNTNTNENTNTNTNNSEKTENTATIDDIIYPMYLPTNTYLTSQETINTDDGQRLILTFSGDSPFTLIEETVSYEEEHVVIPTFGELTHLSDTVGVVNDNSVNWFSNGIEYFVVSDKLSTDELLEVARSISVLPVSK